MEDGDAVMGQPLPSSDCPDEDYEDWDQLDESLFNADNLNLLPDAVELPAPVTGGGGELARTRSDPPASALFKLCGAKAGRLDVAALGAAQPEEWARRNGNGGTPLHVLGASKVLTDAAFAAVADKAPAELWGLQQKQGATPLHRLLGSERLTVAMVKLAAAKAPPEAWLATNKGQQTPAHRLCLNVAAPVRLEMLKAAAKHAPPAVWSMKNKGGATPLEALLTKRMSAVREKTPSISPWVAQMMTDPSPKSRKGGGAAGKGGGGGASGGGAGAAVKLAAARHFFAMGAAGACKLDTGVPVPIQRLDDTRIQMRREVQRQRKGSGIELRHKQSVFAEVKYLISTELDRLPEAKDLPETKDPSERYFKGATGTKEAKQKGAALATHHPSPTHAHPAQPGHAVELSLSLERAGCLLHLRLPVRVLPAAARHGARLLHLHPQAGRRTPRRCQPLLLPRRRGSAGGGRRWGR